MKQVSEPVRYGYEDYLKFCLNYKEPLTTAAGVAAALEELAATYRELVQDGFKLDLDMSDLSDGRVTFYTEDAEVAKKHGLRSYAELYEFAEDEDYDESEEDF